MTDVGLDFARRREQPRCEHLAPERIFVDGRAADALVNALKVEERERIRQQFVADRRVVELAANARDGRRDDLRVIERETLFRNRFASTSA